ncbi:colicin E5-related ribonuclease [Paraburkholderia tropica]|uniref:Colicin-like ribonuclease protein n=1 Tax=Paraburkholderia tropica TaxID=92647 RepID=A0ABX5MEH0_9BURK|nr:colicin E5-related ribonuclease [Paraburkholderia tropica]PXX04221.1 colicin-like ribonuclease protein [Paraburkholderia tropica]PZW69507.1 colicin-like ribonuclease protein [Paraburkholderia tropica]
MTAAQNEALNNSGLHLGQDGLLSALTNAAYALMPWLPGNPVTQAISQAFQAPVYQPNGAANPPADDLGNVTGSSGGGNSPSAPAVVTSFAMALCAASGGEACGLMGMLSPASSSPLPPTNSTLSSGNSGGASGNGSTSQGPSTNNAGFTIEPKIAGQIGTRGWTSDSVAATIANPSETVATQDTRFDPTTGTRRSDPATAYVSADGSYVVVNNKDGTVVQVSNRNNPNWTAPWAK